jgi:hypothetical protein
VIIYLHLVPGCGMRGVILPSPHTSPLRIGITLLFIFGTHFKIGDNVTPTTKRARVRCQMSPIILKQKHNKSFVTILTAH